VLDISRSRPRTGTPAILHARSSTTLLLRERRRQEPAEPRSVRGGGRALLSQRRTAAAVLWSTWAGLGWRRETTSPGCGGGRWAPAAKRPLEPPRAGAAAGTRLSIQ
jgi:hypothetical protein